MAADLTPDGRPLPDVRGLDFSELDADPVLLAALRRLVADVISDEGVISAFGSVVPEDDSEARYSDGVDQQVKSVVGDDQQPHR
jgi:hypothetical protein